MERNINFKNNRILSNNKLIILMFSIEIFKTLQKQNLIFFQMKRNNYKSYNYKSFNNNNNNGRIKGDDEFYY